MTAVLQCAYLYYGMHNSDCNEHYTISLLTSGFAGLSQNKSKHCSPRARVPLKTTVILVHSSCNCEQVRFDSGKYQICDRSLLHGVETLTLITQIFIFHGCQGLCQLKKTLKCLLVYMKLTIMFKI